MSELKVKIDLEMRPRKCEDCNVVDICKWKLGKFWHGNGCNCGWPEDEDWVSRERAAIEMCKKEMKEERGIDVESYGQGMCVWNVVHLGITHKTTAKTEHQAINNVRYKLYGAVECSKLSEFIATREDEERNARSGRISKKDMLNRLSRMGK